MGRFAMELLLIVAIVIIVIGIIMLDGRLGLHMTEVPEGSMKFVVAGGDYIRTILNIKNKRMSLDEETIQVGSDPLSGVKRLNPVRLLGFHWVSWIWPARKVHQFTLTTNILVTETEQGDKAITEWVKPKEHPTDRLDLMIRSYFLLRNVELKGQFKVDVVVFALMEVVNPRLAVFVYGGDFVKILGPAILSGYVDNAKEMDIVAFTDKPKGRGSDFAAHVCKYINTGGEPNDTIAIEEQYGVKLIETYIYEFDQSDKDPRVLAAATAEKVAELEAGAKVKEAEGRARARTIEAEAKAKELSSNIAALVSAGVDPNEAMRAYGQMRTIENVPNLQTLVQSGTTVIPSIPVTPNKKESDQ